jgi:hypothetical protein
LFNFLIQSYGNYQHHSALFWTQRPTLQEITYYHRGYWRLTQQTIPFSAGTKNVSAFLLIKSIKLFN